jgi:hypothetical protein
MLIQVTTQWQSLNTISGLAIGTAIFVQSHSSTTVLVKQQATQPAAGSMDAVMLDPRQPWGITSGSQETWVRSMVTNSQLFVEVM